MGSYGVLTSTPVTSVESPASSVSVVDVSMAKMSSTSTTCSENIAARLIFLRDKIIQEGEKLFKDGEG